MPLFYHLSLIIINYRQDKIIFATNILKKFVHKKIKKKSKKTPKNMVFLPFFFVLSA